MRVGEASDSDEDEASSKDSHDSDGESRKEDVAESKEGNGGSEDGSKAEDGEEDGKADSDASDEEENDDDDDLGSIKSSEPEDDESSDMDSMSELDDDEVKSVYLQVTVHQREWRLFIVAYEPLERKYYNTKFPETMSRSLSNEFKKLDVQKRTATLSVTVSSMTMANHAETGESVLSFQDAEEDDSSSSDDSV